MIRNLLILTALGFFPGALRADELKPIQDEDPALGRPVDFEKDVRPILQANCIACHNVTTNEGDLVLENVEAILKGGSNGPAIVAGKPEESLLYKLSRRGEEPVMPPMPNDRQAKPLTSRELGILKLWIAEGAKSSTGAAKAMNWQPISARLQGVYSLDIDPTGRFITAGRANHVTMYDLSRPETPASLVDNSIISSATKGPAGVAHRDFVHAIAFHPTEPIVATSGYRNVKLWQRDLASLASVFGVPADTSLGTVHAGTSEVLYFAPGKGLVVTNASGMDRGVVALDGQAVTAVTSFASEPKWIIAATADQRLSVIRAADLQVAHKTEPLPGAVTSLSGELNGGRVAALLADGSVRLMTVAADSGAVAITQEVKSDAGPIIRLSGNGAGLLTVAGTKTVQFWKSDDGSQIAKFDLPGDPTQVSMNAATERAAFLIGTTASVWDIRNSKEVASLTADATAQRSLKQAEYQKSVFDSRVAVINGQIGEAEKEVTAQKEAETKAKADVDKQTPVQAEAKKKYDEAAAKTAEAKKSLEGKPDDAGLKAAVTEAEKAEAAAKDAFTKADSELTIARKSVDFATQAIGRAEKRLAERKAQQEAATAEAAAVTAVVETRKAPAAVPVASTYAGLTADGRFAVTADASGTLRVWNSVTGASVDVLPGTQVGTPVKAVAIAGNVAILATEDHRMITRSVFPAWQLLRSIGSEDGAESVFVDRVLSLTFSPDGKLLAAGGGEASRSGQLTLWNVADGSLARQFPEAHSDTVYGLEFSPDGKMLATASADKFAKVFDVASGAFVRAFEGHTHHVMDVSWKSDRTTLASAGADNAIKIWNVETGEQARTITTYSRQVTSLQYVGLQDMIVSSSGDKRVFFHNPSNGNPAREFPGNTDYVYRAATTPDGSIVASGGEDGSVRVWNAADAKVIATFAPAP